MLITFSIPPHPEGAAEFTDVVRDASAVAPALDIKWARGREVRFTLPGATSQQHDAVILALLTLDPQAKIRTVRATFNGLADYQRQRPALFAIHHIDGDRHNNASDNLRMVPIAQNRT